MEGNDNSDALPGSDSLRMIKYFMMMYEAAIRIPMLGVGHSIDLRLNEQWGDSSLSCFLPAEICHCVVVKKSSFHWTMTTMTMMLENNGGYSAIVQSTFCHNPKPTIKTCRTSTWFPRQSGIWVPYSHPAWLLISLAAIRKQPSGSMKEQHSDT